jgi:hypothetical protein
LFLRNQGHKLVASVDTWTFIFDDSFDQSLLSLRRNTIELVITPVTGRHQLNFSTCCFTMMFTSAGSLGAALQRLVHHLLEKRADRKRENDEIPPKQVGTKQLRESAATVKPHDTSC